MKRLIWTVLFVIVLLIVGLYSPVLYYRAPFAWAGMIFVLVGLAGIAFLGVVEALGEYDGS